MTSFGEICPQNSLKVGNFKRKYENRSISKTENPTKPKFEDKAETTTYTSWVGYHYPKPNATWLTAVILKIDMTS